MRDDREVQVFTEVRKGASYRPGLEHVSELQVTSPPELVISATRDLVTGSDSIRKTTAFDIPGWPQSQWYAIYVGAVSISQPFLALDISSLADDELPVKVVLGNHLQGGERDRKRHDFANTAIDGPYTQDELDLIVKPGNHASYAGQPVALLLFDSRESFCACRHAMQTNAAVHQIYGSGMQSILDSKPGSIKRCQQYIDNGTVFDCCNDVSFHSSATRSRHQLIYSDTEFNGGFAHELTESYGCVDIAANDAGAANARLADTECGLIWHDETAGTLNVLTSSQSADKDLKRICSLYRQIRSTGQQERAAISYESSAPPIDDHTTNRFSHMLAVCAAFADGNPVKLAQSHSE